MKIKEMKSILESNKFDNYECNFKVKTKQPGNNVPVWFNNFIQHIFKPTISDVLKEMKAMEHRIMSRIDNLVSKNNLKE